jgi:adenine-specific DNA-methyltransferase
MYARNKERLDNIHVPLSEEAIKRYYKSTDANSAVRGLYRTHPLEATKSVERRENLVYPIPGPNGEEIWPKRQWWWEKERTLEALKRGELEFVTGNDGSLTVHSKQYLKDRDGSIRKTKPFSIIDNVFTQHGTAEIAEIFGDSRVFTFPKPTRFIKSLLQIANLQKDDIVLDFFAGSSATAHALFEMDYEESVQRRFLLVQLPEPVPENSSARNAGLNTISDIGKERIRRVASQKKKAESGKLQLGQSQDLGFRVFQLAQSNFKPWQGSPEVKAETYNQQLELFRDPLKEGWQPESVVWEVALKEGYPLTSRITQANVAGHVVYRVANPDNEQQFHICLEQEIRADLPRQLGLDTNDLFVCRDLALDDSTAANLALQCRLKTI